MAKAKMSLFPVAHDRSNATKQVKQFEYMRDMIDIIRKFLDRYHEDRYARYVRQSGPLYLHPESETQPFMLKFDAAALTDSVVYALWTNDDRVAVRIYSDRQTGLPHGEGPADSRWGIHAKTVQYYLGLEAGYRNIPLIGFTSGDMSAKCVENAIAEDKFKRALRGIQT